MVKPEEIRAYIASKGLKYSIFTYGCQMNDHESEKLRGIVEEIGYTCAPSSEHADLILFNTCCVRDNAEQKLIGNVGALKRQKEANPSMIIAVTGCMTQQEETAQKLARTFPFVDIVLGTHNQYSIAEKIYACLTEKDRVLEVDTDTSGSVWEETPIRREAGPLASVNIMYGCNNYCAYCIVPYVRGRERSRAPEAIVTEVRGLVSQGFKEVMLLGQNVNSYLGREETFPVLLQRICNETDINRIRFMTSHPKDLSDALITTIRDNPQVCKHVHLPVQSGSTRILQTMNRGYTREQYLELLNRLREAIPQIVITTDFIVGFPGETEADFTDTLSLVEKAQFDAAFTFVYSRRSGTKAAAMEGEISEEIQRERILRLIEAQNGITERKNRAYEGKTERVLVEGRSTRDKKHICGRTDGGKMVNFSGAEALVGEFADVKITQGKRTTLFGELAR